MFTDITARKEQERFREGIEGILRHDLRSPLTSMNEYYIALRETEKSATQDVTPFLTFFSRMLVQAVQDVQERSGHQRYIAAAARPAAIAALHGQPDRASAAPRAP